MYKIITEHTLAPEIYFKIMSQEVERGRERERVGVEVEARLTARDVVF